MNNQDTPATPAKKPGGRPALAVGQQSERMTVRLTPQQRETFERVGGATWLRDQLDGLKKILDASLVLSDNTPHGQAIKQVPGASRDEGQGD